MPRELSTARTKVSQPDFGSTRKAHRRITGMADVLSELEFLHDRINQVLAEDAAIADLSASATLAEVITRVNLVTETLRKSGLLRS